MAIKITEKALERIVPFYELGLGAAFIIKEKVFYDDGYKYLKIRGGGDANCNYNAVNLTNGCFSLEEIDNDTNVAEIRAELIFEDNDH